MTGWLFALAALDMLAIVMGDRQGVFPTSWLVLLHIGLTTLALALCLREMLVKSSLNSTKLLIGAAFGPLGILLVGLVKPFEWPIPGTRKLAPPVSEDGSHDGHPRNAIMDMLARTLDDRVSYPEPHQLASLDSTLRYGDLSSRHKALQAVVRSFEPKLSPLIATALMDRDQTLRALAAAASAQINYEAGEKYDELNKKASQQVIVEDTLSLAISLAGHGLHNVLLGESHRMRLIKATQAYFAKVEDQLPDDRRLRKQLAQLHQETAVAISNYQARSAISKQQMEPSELVS